jgi:predicted SAM-dependent methyltransferase
MRLWVDRRGFDFSTRRVLHFAPEPALEDFIRPRSASYVSADLFSESVDVRENIEDLTFKDRTFDVIICSHVLEHVNDSRALSEMYRVLSVGGISLIATPVVEGWQKTYEDMSITTPSQRLLHFGQHDHLRHYGRDVRQRIESAGFLLEEFDANGRECAELALIPGEKIFIASKLGKAKLQVP